MKKKLLRSWERRIGYVSGQSEALSYSIFGVPYYIAIRRAVPAMTCEIWNMKYEPRLHLRGSAPAIGLMCSAEELVGQFLDLFVEFAAEKIGAHLEHLPDILELIAEHTQLEDFASP